MYPISDAVKALFEAEQNKVLRITGTDKNGTAISITDDDVLIDSFEIDRYSCNGQILEIGTAISAQMSMKLENIDGRYDSIIFEGTELYVEVGIADWTQANPTITWVPCGYFTPDIQPRRMTTISITALDRMMWFENVKVLLHPWTTQSGEIVRSSSGEPIYFVSNASLTFPCTVAQLVQRVCALCSVPFSQNLSSLPNYNYTISELLVTDQNISFRNIIQWCAGIMGANAWIDWTGSLRFSWYNNETGYVSTIDNRYSSDLYENAIVITGVKYIYTDDEATMYIAGTDDYAIDLTGNGLVNADNAREILQNIYQSINAFAYTPFSASVIAAPYLWPMDRVVFTDKDGNGHVSALTNVNLSLNGTTALSAIGESLKAYSYGSTGSFSAKQKAELEKWHSNVVADTKEAVDNASAQITGAKGGYVRFMYDENGVMTEILIMNTPDIATATKVWRWNSGGFGYSSNGYQGPFTTAITQDGAIVANFITTGVLNADLILAGTMSADRISGGVIDGETILAKLLNIIDNNNMVIASFDDSIRIGESDKVHINIDYNSFDVYKNATNTIFSVGDLRDSNGRSRQVEHYTGDGSQRLFTIHSSRATIISIKVNGSEVTEYSIVYRPYTTGLTLESAPENGADVRVEYTVLSSVFHYDFGIRNEDNFIGNYSVIEGDNTIASGQYSHAEGGNTVAGGYYSHAEGEGTRIEFTGNDILAGAHAEGYQTSIQSSDNSYAQGAHVEGYQCSVISHGGGNHAEGYITKVNGYYGCHAEGEGTIARGFSQHVAGRYNIEDTGGGYQGIYAEIIGNGTNDSNRSNARTLTKAGNEWIAGTLTQASDSRLKEESGEVPDLSDIRARRFKWNDKKGTHDDDEHIGYFAQDVEKIAPYLVKEDAMGYKSLDYIALLCAKVEQLERRVRQLEEEVKNQ